MNNKKLDEFIKNHYGMLAENVYGNPLPASAEETVLILIDVQKFVTKEYFEKSYEGFDIDKEILMPALEQLDKNTTETLKNIEKVLKACREKQIKPIHIKIESYLKDAADTGVLHTSVGLFYPPNSPAAEFCEEVKPLENEIVLKKTCSGINVGTPIDRILRNLHIKNVIVVGFYTDQCISNSVRELADLGYKVGIIEDAINSTSQERHLNALQGIKKMYANSETTEEFLARV